MFWGSGGRFVLVLYAVLTPRAFHIGRRWTPGTWWGCGNLRTTAGDQYPLFLYLFPIQEWFASAPAWAAAEQRLARDGLAVYIPSVTERLDLSGEIYGI